MKKMMITALIGIAALCGVASTCAPAEPTEETLVYKVKMTINTPTGVALYTKGTVGSVCTPDSGTEASTSVVRTKNKIKVEGWIYDCTATCDTVANGSIVLWDVTNKAPIEDAALAKEFIHVIGKKQTQAEWLTGITGTVNYGDDRTAAYDLTLGAFGKFSTKKGYYTDFSGCVAGSVSQVFDQDAKVLAACDPAGYYLCDALDTLDISDAAVAYGTVSVKYNAAASKKFAKNGYLKVPSYVTIAE